MHTSSKIPDRVLRAVCVSGAMLIAAAQTMAQSPAPPAGWTTRVDGGGSASEVKTEAMKPGFHVTTGPAAILFDSTMRGTGDWRLEATIHLFDPGARAEGFGVFFGGRDLNSAAPTYGYALLRRDGKAILKARNGAAARTVRDWTANAAIPVFKAGPAGTSVKYQLVVEAKGDRVSLWVGPTQVLDAPRSEMPADGIVGLRINHALNVHVERLTVSPLARR